MIKNSNNQGSLDSFFLLAENCVKRKVEWLTLKKIILIICCLILILTGCSKNLEKNGAYNVTRVVDGDTIVVHVNGVDEKIRLTGVDTPESVHPDKTKNVPYGKVSSDYVKDLLSGKKVYLEYDVSKTDRYGRILAYVYLEDGVMLNKLLLEEGQGVLLTVPPNVKYADEFVKAEKQAKKNKKGLWAN